MNTDQNNLNQLSNKLENKYQKKDNVDKRIILQIASAYGFSLVKGSIVIHATLMSKKLLTPVIPVIENELKITSQLIWSINDADLKSLKMSNTSIKVECFHQPLKQLSSNEKLGYLLLKLKGAQTINRTSYDRVDYRSYKLIGTKNCCYNLNISLRIEDISDTTNETSHNKINKKLKMINNNNINDGTNHVEKEDKFKNHTKEINEQNTNLKTQEEKINELEKNIIVQEDITKLFDDKENDQFKENNEIDSPKYNVYQIEQKEFFSKENEVQNPVTFDMQQNIIEELEDWKDKQKILFYEKMKKKEDNLLKEFNKKWFEDRTRIEEELKHNISKCKTLADNMDKMADNLKERETVITAKELEMASQNSSIHDKCKGFVKSMQLSNSQKNNELQNKIIELETKLHNSEKIIILLNKENEQLKVDLNTNCSGRIQQLEKKILNLEREYEESEKSSMFYKERWISSVRKINQMATKLYENNGSEHTSTLNSRQNTQSILTNQSAERKHDEEILRTLLNDLANLRHDMTNINYSV